MSAWLIGECSSTAERDALFRDTIGGLWGLRDAFSTDGDTIQGVDYRTLGNPHGFADAWVVRNAQLCRKSQHPPRFFATDKFVASLVFVAGPLMKSLWEALPATRRGGYAETAADLAPLIAQALEPGDVVMVKGSNGSRAGVIAAALAALGETGEGA